jgi:8-oxo-dGTP diphosphatase
MLHYTLGFLFNSDFSQVLLIHKLSPEWQKGKVNGLGGKFEPNETAQECIQREVKEETDLNTLSEDWKKIGELHSSKWVVEVMAIVYDGKISDAQSVEKEKVEWFAVNNLPNNIMSNLSWLIPMCKDFLVNKEIQEFVVEHVF